jgi:uncharacterized protein (DUF2235 family)
MSAEPAINDDKLVAGNAASVQGRNLIICCDGTNNKFGPENTNVVRLVQVLDRNPQVQRLYYDAGVGTLPNPGALTALAKRLSEYWDLAFAADLPDRISSAYKYLMEIWEPGDRVFLFGFSRGAYTVRVLAGLLYLLGLMPRGGSNMVPYVMRLFGSLRNLPQKPSASGKKSYWDICNEFRWTFARPVPGQDTDNRHFPIHFLGVWDTVSSVGWVWDPKRYPFTAHNPTIDAIRHAVSLDERRAFFRQNLAAQANTKQDLVEIWFPGVHSDVGGGYPEPESALWRLSFEWILGEAQKFGLLVDPQRLAEVLQRTVCPQHPWADPKHESLTPSWWFAEFFPKLVFRSKSGRSLPRLNLGRRRYVPSGALLGRAILERIRNKGSNYAPSNLSASFRNKALALSSLPNSIPYVP